MKTAKQKGKPAQNSSSTKAGGSLLLGNKITKKNSGGHCGGRKPKGFNKDLSSPSKNQDFCSKLVDKDSAPKEPLTAPKEPLRERNQNNNYPVQTLDPSAKIKLQLFPVDEDTCKGLQKDGHYPYLELTLKARKKISSVLKHLYSKWGSASIAVGELTLLPYRLPGGKSCHKGWMLNDIETTAGDVYAATGNPAIFRLRYGWFPNTGTEKSNVPSALTEGPLHCKGAAENCGTLMENMHSIGEQTKLTYKQMSGVPSTLDSVPASLQHELVPKGSITDMENTQTRGEQIKVMQARNVNATVNLALSEQMPSSIPVLTQASEPRVDSNPGQQSDPWDDSFTNISIGGLLSEASTFGFLNNVDSRSKKDNSVLQPSEIVSESFDAVIASQIRNLQDSRQSHESHSSILDAEDTCHAFSFRNRSSLNKDPPTSNGSSRPPIFDANSGHKSSKLSNINRHMANPNECVQESETDLMLCSRVYNDESSLGLTGIKWTDSLGPFDLGLTSSRKTINGDRISIGKIAG